MLARGGRLGLARLATLTACAGLLGARDARAADPTATELQVARSLFAAAEHDEDEARWEPALEKLRKVATVKMTRSI